MTLLGFTKFGFWISLGFWILSLGFNVSYAAGEKYAFLKIPQGAKAMALGNTFAAIADDPSAIHWNPAGIAQIDSREIYSSYTSWLQGTSLANISYVANFNPHAVGVSFVNLSYGVINETSSSEPQGTGASINPADRLITLSYASSYMEKVYGGINLNFISQDLGRSSSSWQSIDLGLLIKNSTNVSFGLAYRNLSQIYNLPRSLRAGFLWRESNALVGVDLNTSPGNKPILSSGLEFIYRGAIALRAGVNTRAETGASGNFSFGLGLLQPKFNIDLAFMPYEDLGNTYRVALGYKL